MNVDKYRFPPFKHQIVGIQHILHNSHAALFDEMGVGKTYQVINAACELFNLEELDVVIIVAPASVRGVWDDPDTGEIKKFCWVPSWVARYDASWPKKCPPKPTERTLVFITVSYAYLRGPDRVAMLTKMIRGRRAMLVLDESSYVKSRKAQQTKAAKKLREACCRSVILNGTPIANNVMDLWAQFHILNPDYIDNMNYFQFRYRYAVMGGYMQKQIVGVRKEEVEKLKAQLAPFIVRREKKDCLDLPEKLYTSREVEMSTKAWGMYQQMRDDMVAWFEKNPTIASHGAVKVMRLSQLTSGILGGFDTWEDDVPEEGFNPVRVDANKLDAFLEFFEEIDGAQLIVWSRFRKEILDLSQELKIKGITCGVVLGGQNDKLRQETINSFQRGEIQTIIGHPAAGGLGLNLTRATIACYLSNDYSLIGRMQSEDRCHRPGQTKNVTYVDFVSVGPQGQKTIDHAVLKALRQKKDMLSYTANDWKKVLTDDV